MPSTRAQKSMLNKLEALYPDAGPELHFHDPYETLVAVMLSAQSTDVQVNKVTPALFERYPTVETMAAARVEDVFPIVRSCGFKSKATNIVETCRLLMIRHGGHVPATMEELTALPGVGRKTANVVLSNAFGVPAIAVDTHVFRVSNRTGLATAKTVEETEHQLHQVIPKKDWSKAHHWLIFHGRRVCHARKPSCEICTLYTDCRFVRQPEKTEAKPEGEKDKPKGKVKATLTAHADTTSASDTTQPKRPDKRLRKAKTS